MKNGLLLLILLFIVVIMVSCRQSMFTKDEFHVINSGKLNQPLKLLTINNRSDSIKLRMKADNILTDTTNDVLKQLKSRMLSTVRDTSNPGVGLAAPQIGIHRKLILVQRFDKKHEPFEFYMNPKIRQYSNKKQDCREGCLSVPGLMDTTKNRSYAVLIEYDKHDSKKQVEMVEGFTAVIFQHEIDHLNGVLFFDYLDK